MNDGWINGDEQRKVEARARSNGMTEYMLDNIFALYMFVPCLTRTLSALSCTFDLTMLSVSDRQMLV